MNMASVHIPVMLNEVIDLLQAKQEGVYLDCTLGGGGHSRAILLANEKNILYAIDRDQSAIERATNLTEEFPNRFFCYNSSFADLETLLSNLRFDGILADLGFSSDQLESKKGFSINDDVELDMRMDLSQENTAYNVVNNYSASDLRRVLKRGGVRFGVNYLIAEIIKNRPINTAKELSEIIVKSVRTDKHKKSHPAIIVFQAIRIEVNEEFDQIEKLLQVAPKLAKENCRFVVISFHSLEDQLITSQMRTWSRGDTIPALWKGNNLKFKQSLGVLVNKEALVTSDEEVLTNSRSRSARLRSFIFH